MILWIWITSITLSSAQNLTSLQAEPLKSNPYSTCSTEKTEKKKWSYCIYRYPNHSQNVVYHFHGILGDERDWERLAEKSMLAYWNKTGKQPPVIVSVSFGKSWFLAEKNSSPSSGLYELFSQKILPILDTKLLPLIPQKKILLGFSMGGLNAAQLYFKMPTQFNRAALICGAMATVSPHASKEEIQDYIKRTQAQSWRVYVALKLSRHYFPSETDWQKHSPVTLAQLNLSPFSNPLYVSNGLSDEFGFHEGNLAFVDTATQMSAPIQSEFYLNEGHCGVNLEPIAHFLTEDSI